MSIRFVADDNFHNDTIIRLRLNFDDGDANLEFYDELTMKWERILFLAEDGEGMVQIHLQNRHTLPAWILLPEDEA